MIRFKRFVATVATAIFAISMVGCNMIEKTPEAIAKSTVAKVNGDKITRGELDEKLAPVIQQLKTQYGTNYSTNDQAKQILDEQKKQALESMITEKVIIQKAKELKIISDESKLDTEASQKFSEIKKAYKKQSDFTTALKQAGFTESSLKDYLKNQLIMSKVAEYVTKDVKVTDKSIQDYYNQHMTEYTTKPNRTHVAHILLKTEAEAKKVKARIDKGEDFAKVAKEVSQDTGSKAKGGDLGFINYTDQNYDKTFLAAAIALPQGKVSDPIKTQFGYHVIKCIKKEEYPIKKLDQVKSQIKETLLQQGKNDAYTKTIKDWRNSAKVKTYDDNLK